MALPISVCILAMNEEAKIQHALLSAKACPWVDEILVFDSGSTDNTVQVAEQFADRVEFHAWVDFSTNRQKLVAAAKNDWVLILDADEEISEDLAREIAALPEQRYAAHPVFEMPRKNFLLGRYVRAWDPDRVARLIDRTRVTWPARKVHDRPEPMDGSVGQLHSQLLHNRHANDWPDYFDGARYASRADALAREMYERGKRASWLDVWLRPWAAFWKFYLFKGGIRDGTFGLLIAQKAAFSVQLKYARLWHLQRTHNREANDTSGR